MTVVLPPRIHYTKPSITALETGYAADAAANGWGERCYDYIHQFERQFREHLGSRFALATSSGTGALHLGMAGLGIGAGDEVILADINWIASAAPIKYVGATPVLVDVLPDTWCLDPQAVEAAITPRTRAIMAVHLYGNLCDMDSLAAIAERHGLALIEDAAEAIGSVWHGRRAGSMGAFGAFSFHGTKTITTGEGGMFVTDDEALFERVMTLSNHGRARGESRQFWPERIGFKYKISNIQAAIGCGQMERVAELVERKRDIFLHYQEALAGLPLSMNPEPVATTNGYWMPTFIADQGVPWSEAGIRGMFERENIDARRFFWPLSTLPMFKPEPDHVVALGIHARAMNLPSYHDMTTADIDRVATIVRKAFIGADGSVAKRARP